MTTPRGRAEQLPVSTVASHARALTLALAVALAIALAALVIVLATSQEGSEPVRVAPNEAPLPPSPAEREQPPGLNGPGMRP
jgi:hypothetical protein